MKKLIKYFILSLVLLCLTAIIVSISCSDGSSNDDDDNNDDNNNDDEITYTEQDIGPEGGTIEDGSGASLTVPADALTETITIQLASFTDYELVKGSIHRDHTW